MKALTARRAPLPNPDLLISSLYAAANGRVGWSTALGDIAHFLGLSLVQVQGICTNSGKVMFAEAGGAEAEGAVDSLRDQDCLLPEGGVQAASTILAEVGTMKFLLTLVRRKGDGPSDVVETSFLRRLMPHFAEALRNFAELHETCAELDMARELLDQFSYPMLLLGENRCIWHRNAAARHLLQQRDALFDQNGFLSCLKSASDEALTKAIRSLCASSARADTAIHRRAIRLRKPNGDSLLALLSVISPEGSMSVFGHAAQILLVLHDPVNTLSRLDPFIVAECFDLTPAEARVATLVVEGATIREIATRQRVGVSTVRSQMQRVMDKAGVSRQADLVRMLLALPMRARGEDEHRHNHL